MSAFIVSNETINRVLHLLALDACCNPKNNLDLGCGLGVDGDDAGRKLWKLNAEAVACRYNEEPEVYDDFTWSPRNYTKFQMLKAATCWMYQCSEGEQFTGSLAFKLVEDQANMVMRSIVYDLPDYDKADWDAPHNPRCQKQTA